MNAELSWTALGGAIHVCPKRDGSRHHDTPDRLDAFAQLFGWEPRQQDDRLCLGSVSIAQQPEGQGPLEFRERGQVFLDFSLSNLYGSGAEDRFPFQLHRFIEDFIGHGTQTLQSPKGMQASKRF